MQLTNLPIVLVPCFSGAPWHVDAFPSWGNRPRLTGAFQDIGSIEAYADEVGRWTDGLSDYVLVGDSFGALVSLAYAIRQPAGLRALVLSGGFARARVSWLTRMQVRMAGFLGQRGYRLTVSSWVKGLGSPFDPPGTREQLESLFHEYSDAGTFVHRAQSVFASDFRRQLGTVAVPTLVLTPEHDRLIGPDAAGEMLAGIPLAEERILGGTGHLLRFTHARAYAEAIDEFLSRYSDSNVRVA